MGTTPLACIEGARSNGGGEDNRVLFPVRVSCEALFKCGLPRVRGEAIAIDAVKSNDLGRRERWARQCPIWTFDRHAFTMLSLFFSLLVGWPILCGRAN